MYPPYAIADASAIYSPALVFYRDLIRRNIARMIEIAGDASRLRPHAKTHKTREIVGMELEAGIAKHKCATIAEAEMLAGCGVQDILLAYPLVGPNCGRLAKLAQKYPDCRFAVVADHAEPARALSEEMKRAGRTVDVLLDLDVGQHRTGIAAGPEAAALYQFIGQQPGLRAAGFHVYDGHNHQEPREERETAVRALLEPVSRLRADLAKNGLPVPQIVLGGTPTFTIFAQLDLPGAELSPGTCVLHDHSYGSRFRDMDFTPAALLLTRVISKPAGNRLTLDLGYKAVASDPPGEKRCLLLNVPDYRFVLQNEEHLVVETPAADRFAPGAEIYAVPYHICPTVALHRFAYVVENGKMAGQWEIVGRDRVLSV